MAPQQIRKTFSGFAPDLQIDLKETVQYEVVQGKAIVQIIVEKISIPLLEEIQEISPTTREDRGFGALD